MAGPLLTVARAGDRSGYLIAGIPPEGQEHLAPSQRTSMGSTLVVGSLYRISPDGEPERWRAWLWPQAGGDLAVTQSCEAVDAATPEKIRDRLQKQADKDGPWWDAEAPVPRHG